MEVLAGLYLLGHANLPFFRKRLSGKVQPGH